jgi:hypothetical protein
MWNLVRLEKRRGGGNEENQAGTRGKYSVFVCTKEKQNKQYLFSEVSREPEKKNPQDGQRDVRIGIYPGVFTLLVRKPKPPSPRLR